MTLEFPITNSTLQWLEGILAERFSHKWHLTRSAAGLRLALEGGEGAIVFDAIEPGFTHARSDQPFTRWHAEREGWLSVLGGPLPAPGVERLPTPLIEKQGADTFVHYDILGLTYWMLARVEEICRTDLDNHDRFPATSSHAYKHGYLERPIVDEWMYILGQVIQHTWPGIALKQHQFSMKVSHDVDQPSLYAFKAWSNIGRIMAGHLIKRHDIQAFFTAPYVKFITKKIFLNKADPYNTFDWLMDQSEAHGLISSFNFICGTTCPKFDADYELENPVIRNLLRRIHHRRHEIGLHPSYNTYKNSASIKQEADRLRRICTEEGVEQAKWGGRMHYLRWEQPSTLRAWAEAGMDYDSSLGYADWPGFRCGTAFEYTAFDPVLDKQLSLRIRPLIVMDCTVIGKNYMGLGATDAALDKIIEIKKVCKKVGGVFSMLWHNSYFKTNKFREIYLEAVKY